MPSNRNDPTAFSAQAKRKNNVGPINQGQGRLRFKEVRKGRCFNCMLENVPIKAILHEMMINNFKGNGNQRNNRFNNKGKRGSRYTKWKWSTFQEIEKLQV